MNEVQKKTLRTLWRGARALLGVMLFLTFMAFWGIKFPYTFFGMLGLVFFLIFSYSLGTELERYP